MYERPCDKYPSVKLVEHFLICSSVRQSNFQPPPALLDRSDREARNVSTTGATSLIGSCGMGEILFSNEEGEASTTAPVLN